MFIQSFGKIENIENLDRISNLGERVSYYEKVTKLNTKDEG